MGMIWFNKYIRTITCLVMIAYMFSASNCAPWLINKIGDFGVTLSTGDFPCKGHGCGCKTALQCLTDCCCVKTPEVAQTGSCCKKPPKIVKKTSCCSEEEAGCPPQNEEIDNEPPKVLLLAVGCRGAQKEYFEAKRTLHIYLPQIKKTAAAYNLHNKYVSFVSFYRQNVFREIDKVPIA